MSKHTKGPWHTGQGNGEGSIFADEGRMRFENGTVLYPICRINTGWDEAEDAANARLVAAAPELFEALHYLLEQTVDADLKYGIELSEGEADARAKALAVFAKISGESND